MSHIKITYFPYAVIFTNRENVFVDIQPQRIPGYRKLKQEWSTEKCIDSRTRHERSGIMLHKRDLEFTRDSEKIGDRKVSPVFGGV
jgi:hypothetical protein